GSMKWLLTPNSVLAIKNPSMLLLAVVVLITGMVLFTGTIIALTTNAIKDYIQKKQSGSGKIFLENHVVILNWNNKVPELVADLLYLEDRKVTVMVLANIDKGVAEKQIMNAIKELNLQDKKIKDFNILVKNGNPLIDSDLYDISILEASAILIMNQDAHDEIAQDMSKSDLNIIKIILTIGRLKFKRNPPIVAEVKNIVTKEKVMKLTKVVDTLQEHTVLPICFDRRLGQIIAQTIINPKMEDVYLSLFSFKDAEVYYSPNQEFAHALTYSSRSIPLAKAEKGVFVLAENDLDVGIESEVVPEIIKLQPKVINEAVGLEVYIIGTNNKLDFIMTAFKQYEQIHQSRFLSKYVPTENLDELLRSLNQNMRPTTLVLLSDEYQQADSLDANIIDTLIQIESELKNKDVNIIVELLDPRNDPIISDFNIRNTIISNKIISLLMSKLVFFKETAPFYDNLLTIAPNEKGEDDQAIIIRAASELFADSMPITFPSIKSFVVSVHAAFSEKIIPMGIFKGEQLGLFFGNLLDKEITINKDDQIVLMKL
ncbi:MAG TPA: hypothetical protein VJZ51_01250, partial [Bacilli bacterium]|nr:hypothetical protein [Bacilli bacterium]